MKYSKEGNKKNILVCQVYVNNKIEGIKSRTTFPKIPNTDKYYDTGVDNINNPKIYIKKSVEYKYYWTYVGRYIINKRNII